MQGVSEASAVQLVPIGGGEVLALAADGSGPAVVPHEPPRVDASSQGRGIHGQVVTSCCGVAATAAALQAAGAVPLEEAAADGGADAAACLRSRLVVPPDGRLPKRVCPAPHAHLAMWAENVRRVSSGVFSMAALLPHRAASKKKKADAAPPPSRAKLVAALLAVLAAAAAAGVDMDKLSSLAAVDVPDLLEHTVSTLLTLPTR